jgi:ABC-type transport system substrate-binding protein
MKNINPTNKKISLKSLIHQITRILWEDAWFIPLFEGVVIKALRNEWEYDHLPSTNSFYLTNLRKK